MGKPKNQPDSYAPIVAELAITTEAGRVPLAVTEYLQGIEVELTSQGSWKGKIDLFDAVGDYLESLVLSAGSGRLVDFRFGWDNGSINELPQFTGSILQYHPKFTVEGIALEIEVISDSVLTAVMDKVPRNFPANMTATEIFLKIAKARGWQTDAEPSDGRLSEFTTRGESDVKFIVDQLLPQAKNSRGESFRFFFDVNDIAHFHSFMRSDEPHYKLAAEYIFAHDANGEVISFEPSDNVFQALMMGGGTGEFVAANSNSGTSAREPATDKAGVKGTQITSPSDATARPPTPPTNHFRTLVPSRDPDELRRRAQVIWSNWSRVAFTADLVVRGTHAVEPFDFISVRYVKKSGEDHYMSGTFLVLNVSHSFGTSGWTTSMKLARDGMKVVAGADRLDVQTSAQATADANTQTSDTVVGQPPSATVQPKTIQPGAP